MSQKAKSALTLAYNSVISLGWTHAKLRETYKITLPTLRRIRSGVKGKVSTDGYCLKVFVSILNEEYDRRVANGGDGRNELNMAFREILLAQLDIRK